jgi:hypothetical protein
MARGGLGKEAALRLIRRVATCVRHPVTSDQAERLWEAHRVLSYQPQLDRYAQICVVQPEHPLRPSPQLDSFVGELHGHVILSIHPLGGNELEPSSGMVVESGNVGISRLDVDSRTGSYGSVERSAIREMVAAPNSLRVVASKGYDLRRGDLAASAVQVMADLPHAVLASAPFLPLWRGLSTLPAALGEEPGVRGATQIEFAVVPSALGSDYAYLVMRPSPFEWPIVLVPMVTRGIERGISWARQPDVVEDGGVTLVPSSAPSLRIWAGAGLPHLCAAIAVYEGWFSEDTT